MVISQHPSCIFTSSCSLWSSWFLSISFLPQKRLTLGCVVAAVPAGGFHLFLGNRAHVDLGLQPVQHREPTELLACDRWRDGPSAAVTLADHLQEKVHAAAEIGLVAE